MVKRWEEIEDSVKEQVRYLKWVEFWTNRVPAWLYGGYREDYKDRPFPMDN